MSGRRRGCSLALVAALFPDPAAGRDTRRCFSEVELSPAQAVVGEQVLYRVRIFSREDVAVVEWSQPPAFPNFRTETLPGDPQPAAAGDFRVRDERRALFAERPGTHVLRAPVLRCTAVDGELSVARVPEAVLRVDALPDAGRPDDFTGLVGVLSLFVTVTPKDLALGESLRVAVMARSDGNLWTLPQPFAADAFGSAEVFGQRPKLVLDRGRSLSLRRHFAFDVVPREPGLLEVPALALPFFDPEARGYRVARSEAVRVRVRPRAEAASAGGSARRERDPSFGARDPDKGSRAWGWLLALPLLASLAAILWLWRGSSGRGNPTRAARSKRPWAKRTRAALAATEALDDREPLAAALALALREALTAHVDDARTLTPEELMARSGLAPQVAAAAQLLASLERARFDPEAPPPDAAAVRRTISEL